MSEGRKGLPQIRGGLLTFLTGLGIGGYTVYKNFRHIRRWDHYTLQPFIENAQRTITTFFGETLPDWYYYLSLINPLSIYGNLNSIALNLNFGQQISFSYPTIFSGELMTGLLILWIVVFILLAIWRFNKKDV